MKQKQTSAETSDGRFAYEGLDRVLHERARLSVLTTLVTHPRGVSFNDLKQLCALTDGNLSRHLQVLEKEGIVEVVKGEQGSRPHTTCHLTALGRKRYLEYLETLEQVIRDAAKGIKDQSKTTSARNLSASRA